MSLKKTLNHQPESGYTHEIIFEELRELAGLSSNELKIILRQPLKETLPETVIKVSKEKVTSKKEKTPVKKKDLAKKTPSVKK